MGSAGAGGFGCCAGWLVTSESDIHLVAYASLYETVRRFLEDEANRSYLGKRHRDIEEDLQRAVAKRAAEAGATEGNTP